ncbi:MAG: ATP:cob(I)alamin adenosyltransferase [Desulfobacteraceae bacterium 4572_35.2]|nr:MAG: ATP:cob(I)alamin adenosyltransferase [Desulfobacteraceae bacterium 4572_35.2]
MEISTGTGDGGQTSLTGGQRVSKNSLRVCAYGTIDELSSLIGVIVAETPADTIADSLRQIQSDLFNLGTDISTPNVDPALVASARIKTVHVERLEQWAGSATKKLPVLREFILPGGCRTAAWLHLARTVARRAEREVVAVCATEGAAINQLAIIYLNRLSDLLFLWARIANDFGQKDVTWSV